MDREPNLPLAVIVGPTGSGKSDLALELAASVGGEIVNCDSLQLYRGFDIGTAKTPPADRRGIPHHLFDVLDPRETCSAGDYARLARSALTEISARGRLPIVVGGTGFYLRALLSGLPVLPPRDTSLRQRLTSREQRTPGSLHRLLARLEPAAATRIHARDVQKIIRALEVRLLTKNTIPDSSNAEPLLGYRILKIGLDPDRAELVRRLDARVLAMFESGLVHGGLIEEVEQLLAGGCTGGEKPFESLGYKQALEHLRGETTLDQAILSTQIETRQYGKRQLTWFRRDTEIRWFREFGNTPEVIQPCLQLVRDLVSA